jgi:phage host-nuclease inhibitor protein Gam
MPITEGLKTAQELRAAGASPALAEVLAAKFEAVAVATRDAAFRDILVELKALRTDISGDMMTLRTDISGEVKTLRMEVAGELKAIRTDVSGELKTMRTDVSGELKTMRTEVSGELKTIRTEFTGELKELRAEIELRFAKMETLIAQSGERHERSLRMFMGMALTALGVAVAIIKLFPNAH